MLRPMFFDFYKLREQPFSDTPDPRFTYLSRTHREALASLFYGLETARGFLALIAEPGMGKTTLLFHVLELLRRSARTAFLFQTQCDSRELLRYLLADIGIDSQEKDLAWVHEQLKQALIDTASAGKRFVVFIDEAQNLGESVLETIRLLSDFETPHSKLMQIVLTGQPQLADTLARPALAQLRQRISILSRLHPFTPAEVDAYVNHRLKVAGDESGHLFTPEARVMIAAKSKGVPRNINNLCFNSLSLGYALGKKEIDSSLIVEVADDLEMSPLGSKQHDGAFPDLLQPGRVTVSQAVKQVSRMSTASQPTILTPEPAKPGSAVDLQLRGSARVEVVDDLSRDAEVSVSDSLPVGSQGSRASVVGCGRKQASRAMMLVGAALVVLFVAGAAGAFFLHRGSMQHPVTNLVQIAPPVSIAANTVQRERSASNRRSVASQLTSQEPTARKPAWAGKILIIAPVAATPRSTATIGRDAPPDLTSEASDAPGDAIQGVLPWSSHILPALAPASEPTAPVLVGGSVKEPQLVSKILPNYPPAAKKMGLEGNVVIDAVIDTTGNVTNMKVVSGPPLLQPATLDSVRKWKFQPAYLDDKSVARKTLITVEFRLH